MEARRYYDLHPERFLRPETRRVRHILITVNEQYPENSPQAARERIEALRAELAAVPSRFAEVAERHSECPTALEGGLVGSVPRGVLHPELDEALFALEAGGLSGIDSSPMGLHFVLCEEIVPEGLVPFEAVEARIRDHLASQAPGA